MIRFSTNSSTVLRNYFMLTHSSEIINSCLKRNLSLTILYATNSEVQMLLSIVTTLRIQKNSLLKVIDFNRFLSLKVRLFSPCINM